MNVPDFNDTRSGSSLSSLRPVALAVVVIAAGLINSLNTVGGAPVKVTATDVERFTVYHSPQTPGYTCWVGTWVMPDETLMVSFHQATGPFTYDCHYPANHPSGFH